MPPRYWTELNQLAEKKNPGYQKFIEGRLGEPLYRTIAREKQLEESLVQNPNLLKRFGDLELYSDPVTGTPGRQMVCEDIGGRIDLLFYDRKGKRYVVVELKNVRAGLGTFGQICDYVGWVQDKIAGDTPVIGLVISRGFDAGFESCLRVTDRILHLNIRDLGFE